MNTLLLLLISARLTAATAFPGAEGFGAQTPGGRGGAILFVHNLNDAGPGSLRAALETKGPRIVLFRVAGIVELKSPISVTEPFLTLAGQSAPGGGICLRGAELRIETHDVIVRHIRVRTGDIAARERDGLFIGAEARNVIVDHCSVSWAIDENLSPSGAIADITVQWSIIAEGLNRSVHHKGAHGYGTLARAVGGVTFHHNLWAHNQGRNPRLGDNYGKPPFPTFDVRNNVIYNPGGSNVVGDELTVNYTGNYIKPGPDTRIRNGIFGPTAKAKPRFFVQGNVIEGMPDLTASPQKLFDKAVELLTAPAAAPAVETQPAAQAFDIVLNQAGATLPKRDAVDARIVSEVRAGAGAIIDSQWEVGGWPKYEHARPPRDSDRDGMPDDWELARNLNPRSPADAAQDRDGDGYTNIEEYLNSIR
ncbi:MAG: hypothetical protein JNK48_01705 [Bryobacterales bacterium]|nr:hypothetical protein [Bryobacterales bacterium]